MTTVTSSIETYGVITTIDLRRPGKLVSEDTKTGTVVVTPLDGHASVPEPNETVLETQFVDHCDTETKAEELAYVD